VILEADQVRDLLPHRFPMLLVDRVLDAEPGVSLTAVKAITVNEPCYADGGDLAYPEVLVMESWGQAAGVLVLLGEELGDRVMLFGSMSGVDVHRRVLPGDVLEHRVRIFRALADTVIFEGDCRVAGEPVMTVGRMVMAFRGVTT
jgi:3-hydroxyacyl-[acyl-carrier-protein] dehydratase